MLYCYSPTKLPSPQNNADVEKALKRQFFVLITFRVIICLYFKPFMYLFICRECLICTHNQYKKCSRYIVYSMRHYKNCEFAKYGWIAEQGLLCIWQSYCGYKPVFLVTVHWGFHTLAWWASLFGEAKNTAKSKKTMFCEFVKKHFFFRCSHFLSFFFFFFLKFF